MPTSTMTSKGQITLPKAIREHLHVTEGDQVDFSIARDGDVVMHRLNGSVSSLAGMLHRPGRKTISLTEMDDVVADAVLEKAKRR